MKWIFENYGYPSLQKIGSSPLLTLFSHFSASDEYPYFENKLKEYVKKENVPQSFILRWLTVTIWKLKKMTSFMQLI